MSSSRRIVRRRGQAAVEFALVLPMLLVLLVGIIEFGRAWNEHMVITDAAREAARRGALHDDSGTVNATSVKNVALAAMAAAGINPARCPIAGTCMNVTIGGANEPVVVTINLPYQFTFFGPLVKWATGESNITLRTTFSMRHE